MNYEDYEKAFSPPRLNRYLAACGGSKVKALTLYRQNLKLCQKFYGILNIFEVVFRNAIDSHYKTYFGDNDWILNQCADGCMLSTAPQKNDVLRTYYELNRTNRYSNDRLVSSVTFGFWTYLFNKLPYRGGGNTLLQIFPNRTSGLAQRPIFNELQQIKSFRNRIAHHEAICFNTDGNIDLSYCQTNLELIKKYVYFLDYDPVQLFWGTGIKPYTMINKITSL